MLRLQPKIHSYIHQFIEEQKTLEMLVRGFGSPINILFPELIRENINRFQQTFDELHISGKIFYAHKVNKSSSLVKQSGFEGIGVDVASRHELSHALSLGIPSHRIEATGPKNKEFITQCLNHTITIAIDNYDELVCIISLAKQLKISEKISVIIRLTNFHSQRQQLTNRESRFGIPVEDLPDIFSILKVNKQIDIKGFSFHLDTVNTSEKAIAVDHICSIIEGAMQQGFSPRVINIGGGFKVNYLEKRDDWDTYMAAYKQAAMGSTESLAWQQTYTGLQLEKSVIRGNGSAYNYFEPTVGSAYLKDLLQTTSERHGKKSLASLLRDGLLELWIEPGRSLVDQTGITVAEVIFTKKTSAGSHLVGLDMKRQDIVFNEQEPFVDPIVLYNRQKSKKENKDVGVYFVGNLCLESDVIYKHKTFLPELPKLGALVIFVNTAGYMMDFSATTSILQPLAQKIAVWGQNKKFYWSTDEQYSPLHEGDYL